MKKWVSLRIFVGCLCNVGSLRLIMLSWNSRFLWNCFCLMLLVRFWLDVVKMWILIGIGCVLLIWLMMCFWIVCSSFVCRWIFILEILLRRSVLLFVFLNFLIWWVIVLVKVFFLWLNSLDFRRCFGMVV